MARLNNLRKLYLVPVLAIRQMLARKLASDETRLSHFKRLKQAELIAEIDRAHAITEEDIDQLYELFRYGRRLSLQLYLLPDDYAASGDDESIERAITAAVVAAARATEAGELGSPNDDDFSWDEASGQVTICDHVRFGEVLEIRFKYPVLHQFLNLEETLDQVYEIRYGYVWLCSNHRYLAILAKDDAVAKTMLETASAVLNVTPKSVQFPKDLIDRHFSIESVRRLSHLDPRSGVRQSISGEADALSEYMDEIIDRERQYQRPGALYDEKIDDTISSGLGITARRGKFYFTRTLSTSQVQRWRDTRLRGFVADLHATLAQRPLEVYQATVILRRLRGLDPPAQTQLRDILNAILHAKHEGLQTVQLQNSAHAVYQLLGANWLQPYLSFDCPECDEACGICLNCGQSKLILAGQEISCANCGQTLSTGGVAAVRCVNDHLHHFDLAEAIGYTPTKKLARLIKEFMTFVDVAWDSDRDSIFLDAAGLHHLSAPPDHTLTQIYGDVIKANIGSGASNVIVGKDIHGALRPT